MLHALVLDSFTSYVNQGAWYLPLPDSDQAQMVFLDRQWARLSLDFFSRNGA